MTISSATNKVRFLGNGISTLFPFSFKVFKSSDLVVVLTNTSGLDTPLLIGSHYTVSLNVGQDSSPGGEVTMLVAPSIGEYLSIVRQVEATQLTDITNQGGFYPRVIEDSLDKLTMLAQQALEKLARGLTLPVGANPNASGEIPGPQGLTLLGWDAAGTRLINYSLDDLGVSIAAATWQTETFTGNGSTTVFTLAEAPGNASNCDVTIGGVTQIAGVDFSLSGLSLTFVAAPPSGAAIAVRYGQALSELPVALSAAWGGITGTMSSQTDLNSALGLKAPLASPTFTGTVTLPSGQALTNPALTNYTETTHAPAAASAFTVDLANGTLQKLTTNANCTITLPASTAGKSFTLIVAYGGTHTITWAGGGTLKWSGGAAPAATSANGKFDIYVFTCDGTNTFGADGGRNF